MHTLVLAGIGPACQLLSRRNKYTTGQHLCFSWAKRNVFELEAMHCTFHVKQGQPPIVCVVRDGEVCGQSQNMWFQIFLRESVWLHWLQCTETTIYVAFVLQSVEQCGHPILFLSIIVKLTKPKIHFFYVSAFVSIQFNLRMLRWSLCEK